MTKGIALVIILVAAVAIISAVVVMKNATAPGSAADPSGDTGRTELEASAAAGEASRARIETKGASVIENAAADGKYAFIFFYSDESEVTQSARSEFGRIISEVADKAVPLEIDTRDPAEMPTVNKFNVRGAPMPLVLAVAPNGAITGGFPTEFSEAQLLGAFASPGQEKSLKALQERRIVILSIQNGTTASNEAAMKGVRELKTDPNFGPSTVLVAIDPADPVESGFLEALQVSPQTKEAITVCLVPPGRAIARFNGGTEKDAIVAALSSGGGCGPNGCGPNGCGN